jgi:hypothetical protein
MASPPPPTRKRIGRPTTAGREREKATLGIRASAELKARLLDAAEVAGRSLSAEAEFRLEGSFQVDAHLLEAQVLAYGPALAVAMAVIGRAVTELSRSAMFPRTWSDEPHLAREAPWAAEAVMGGFLGLAVEQPANVIIAPMIVWSLLAAVKDPDNGPSDVREWARPLRRALGDEGAARVWVNTTLWMRGTERGLGSAKPVEPKD